MTYFLTSSHCVPGAPDLNPANGFAGELKTILPSPCRALFICSDGDAPDFTDMISAATKESFGLAGFVFSDYQTLDRRTAPQAAAWVRRADLIVLAGGHVPTQNRFFTEIGLRELLHGYTGVVLAISAGSMNSADLVYAQPELEGEAISKDYKRFLPGLGLTKTMLLPHYQMVKNDVIDGLRLYEEITYPDSMGRCFYALVDGSYLYGHDGIEEIRGEAYRIQDGIMEQISREGDVILL